MIIEITSRSNSFLQHVRKITTSSSYRKETGLFLGDGKKLLEAGIQAQFPLEAVVLSQKEPCPEGILEETKVYRVPESVMEWISPMKTPQGALFLGKIPEIAVPETLPQGQYLLLEGVQDPGNVGTIWRTAQGLGIDGLFLLEGCASPWNPKTVRSSMGACFYKPIYTLTGEEAVALWRKSQLPLYGTCLEEDSHALAQLSLAQGGVVLGSEGKGISPKLLSHCDKTLYIPMGGGCESLNVASVASIVLWEQHKSREYGER